MKTWGGSRSRAGRKKIVGRRRVEHRTRERIAGWVPVHVNVHVVEGLPSLRRDVPRNAIEAAFAAGCERPGFRLVEYSIMTNHLHLVVEAESAAALTRGMQGLLVRIARRLNRALIRKGRVFADRYHSRVVGSTLDVKNTLAYVLGNARRHGIAFEGPVDPCSSAAWFRGWDEDVARPAHDPPVAKPRTWQLVNGWQMHGRINPFAVPGGWKTRIS